MQNTSTAGTAVEPRRWETNGWIQPNTGTFTGILKPDAALLADGKVRIGQYTFEWLPSAGTEGTGAAVGRWAVVLP